MGSAKKMIYLNGGFSTSIWTRHDQPTEGPYCVQFGGRFQIISGYIALVAGAIWIPNQTASCTAIFCYSPHNQSSYGVIKGCTKHW